MKKISKWAKA